MMICARRFRVYALFLGFFVCAQSIATWGKEGKEGKAPNAENNPSINSGRIDQFQWPEHSKLSWDDFRGPVSASSNESAAATHCGIGFKTNTSVPGKPAIIVYNTFYAKKSWVRPDAKIQSILDHEQGHFDLCEIYTRKLRERMKNFDFNVPDITKALMSIYTEISNEYESRQQAYEQETIHGTNIMQQKRWLEKIALELL